MPELAAHLERVAKELSEAVDYFCIGADDHDYENCEKCARMKAKITPIVAAALAACAREEAKWWSDLLDDAIWGDQAFLDQEKGRERLRALERAVGEKGQA